MIVFKAQYSPQLRHIGIRKNINHLLDKLRVELGQSFLRDARVVVAHPLKRSLFVDTYCWNYTKDDCRLHQLWQAGGMGKIFA